MAVKRLPSAVGLINGRLHIPLRPSAVDAGDCLAIPRLPRPLQALQDPNPTQRTLIYNSHIDINSLMLDTRSLER